MLVPGRAGSSAGERAANGLSNRLHKAGKKLGWTGSVAHGGLAQALAHTRKRRGQCGSGMAAAPPDPAATDRKGFLERSRCCANLLEVGTGRPGGLAPAACAPIVKAIDDRKRGCFC